VVITGFWAKSNFLDFNLGLSFAGFAFLLFFIVQELAEVHNPAYGWVRIWGNFHQVQTGVVCPAKRLAGGDDADVFTVLIHQAHFFYPDAFVNSIFLFTTDLLFSLIN
jgi:hypothetical protein